MGGGGTTSAGAITVSQALNGAAPSVAGQTPDGWRATSSSGSATVTVYVVCTP